MKAVVTHTDAPAGYFHQVHIDPEDGRPQLFTGFTLLTPFGASDEHVLWQWQQSGIIIEHELSYGGNYEFADIPFDCVLPFGAVAVICEGNGYDEREDEYNPLVRVVTKDYEPGANVDGYTPVHSAEERELREGGEL